MKIKFIQDIIDKIRGKENIPYATTIAKKITGANKFIDQVDTLIIGSSHMARGYVASQNEYNIATSSQDFYYNYELLKIYNRKNIHNIILGISYFYPWHVLIKTKDFSIFCSYFKILTGIDYQYPDIAKEKKLYDYEK